MGRKIEKWIDLSGLPRNSGGAGSKFSNRGTINWSECAELNSKVKFKYKDVEGVFTIIGYDTKTKHVTITRDNAEISNTIFVGHFKDCKIGSIVKEHTREFKFEIGYRLKTDNKDMIVIDREYKIRYDKNNNKYYDKWYKYKCNKCGWEEGWVIESGLNKGCSCCANQIVVPHINSIVANEETHWMIPYFQGETYEEKYNNASKYIPKSGQRVQFVCPHCNQLKKTTMAIYNLYYGKSINCTCSDSISYPSKIMIAILNQLGIDFLTEYSPEWIKPKRYDFYFEYAEKKYIIEMDGEQHKRYKSFGSKNGCFETQTINDEYKDRLANENNIEVIRIDCEVSDLNFIRNNILNSKLNNVFNLLEINWNKTQEFALSNLCKKSCELKRDNPNMATSDISNKMGLHKTTILRYLKNGSQVWDWCKYDAEEERKKNGIKCSKSKSKPVEVFKDGISLGLFASAREIERQSEELFGVKLLNNCIPDVCNGKRKLYKGYTFKYVD